MRKGGTFLRRLEKLESTLNVLSTEDKRRRIHDKALEFMSDEDLEVLEAVEGAYQTAEQFAAMARFDDACFTSAVTSKPANGGHPKTGQWKDDSGQALL